MKIENLFYYRKNSKPVLWGDTLGCYSLKILFFRIHWHTGYYNEWDESETNMPYIRLRHMGITIGNFRWNKYGWHV